MDFNILPYVLVESATMDAFAMEQPITSSGARMPQSPRRLTHQLPPRLNIHPTASSELGPPAQAQVVNSWKTIKPFAAAAAAASAFCFLFYLKRTMHFHLHSCQCARAGDSLIFNHCPLASKEPLKTPSKDRRVILYKHRDTGDLKL